MILVLQIIFWVSFFLILHSYILYPAILKYFIRFAKSPGLLYSSSEDLPNVFVIIAVFNEEELIEEKLDSLFNTDYPPEKINIIIGSDASTDRTDDIIKRFQNKSIRLDLMSFMQRSGKANVLNKLIAESNYKFKNETDILIFTDANVIFDRKTIFNLVKNFKNPKIAQVAAKVINRGMKRKGISFQENFYISRENDIKYYEGKLFGTMMGAFGACFAHKAKLFTPIPKNHIVDDFYLTMKMLQNGYDCISSVDAICYEDLPHHIGVEYKRKKRISTGNFQNLFIFWKSLFSKRMGLSFSFFSHKFLRWTTPFFILACGMILFVLSDYSYVYHWLFLGMLITLLIPICDKILQIFNVNIPIFRFITYFYTMNVALLHGFFEFLLGRNQNIWEPTLRVKD